MNVLALNCGSSTVKFRLVAVEPGAAAADGRGLAGGTQEVRGDDPAAAIVVALAAAKAAGAIEAVGHRVGGARFTATTVIDGAMRDTLTALTALAPLHSRPSIAGIRAGCEALGAATPMVAAREAADARARLAVDVFCHRARKYVGAYLAALEGADAVVFTGGIGEHAPEIRRRIAAGFAWCGRALDAARNDATRGRDGVIGADGSAVAALVVAADEERMIAAETAACLARR